MKRYAWLFDQRFEALRESFEASLRSSPQARFMPIDAYREFPDVTPPATPGTPAELRQQAPEDVNCAFTQRWREGKRWGHDGRAPLPLVSFTMDGVDELAGVEPFGVRGAVVRRLSDKALQYALFRDAGLPVPDFTVVVAEKLVERGAGLLAAGPLMLQPGFSAGGEQATLARRIGDLAAFRERFADSTLVVAARFVPECRTLSGNAIVTRDRRVIVLGVTELLQDGFRFDGFVFPSFESAATTDAIERVTLRVGELLRAEGYWGWFTADFLLRADGEMFLTESNVRFSGEAAFIAAAASHNVFELMNGAVRSPCGATALPDERIVVTKIRPLRGQIAAVLDESDEMSFLRGVTNAFRVGYHRRPVYVVSGHFVGLAGARLCARESRVDALRIYRAARRV